MTTDYKAIKHYRDGELISEWTSSDTIEMSNGTALTEYVQKIGDSNFISVSSFGAVGDGTTDDTEAFLNAISNCKEKGRDLYIPAGTYLIKERLVIETPMTIQGASISETTLSFELPDPSTETKYDATYWEESNSAFIIKADNVTISDFTIKNVRENKDVNGFIFHYPKNREEVGDYYASAERCIISSVEIKDFDIGIFVYAGWSRHFTNLKITDCNYGIKYEALEDINWSTSGDVISNCYIVGGNPYGLYMNKTFETRVEGCIFEYNDIPIYCANALDTIFIDCWNEANTNNISIDGNAKFINGYNITNETITQTENGTVTIDKPHEVIALRNNEVVFRQVNGIIVKGVSLGSSSINLIKNASFGTIADKNFNNWNLENKDDISVSDEETYQGNNSAYFNFCKDWPYDPYYGIESDAITLTKGQYTLEFAYKSPDKDTIDYKAKYLIMEVNSEGDVVAYYVNEEFMPNGNNIWEKISKTFTVNSDTDIVKVKIQLNRNGLLYVSSPVLASADISSDSINLKQTENDKEYNIVNQVGTVIDTLSTVVDDSLSETSENPVQNKAITSAINNLSKTVSSIAGGGSGSSGGASSASELTYDNTTSGLTATTTQAAIDEVFQSVSNGKQLLAEAITDKGVTTSATDTFSTMAANIKSIVGSGSSAAADTDGYITFPNGDGNLDLYGIIDLTLDDNYASQVGENLYGVIDTVLDDTYASQIGENLYGVVSIVSTDEDTATELS